ncbi:hypothetical protein C0989_009479 [Termitomyces sp. Mn162]|nr:hypothetical protein C0989_009479 [Termitomyces sp. Mn162]
MTAAMVSKGTKLKNNARNAVLVVAFLLEDNVTDQSAESIADAVATGVLACMGAITDSLASSSEFASATSTSQVETTLALKTTVAQLAAAMSSLGKVVAKLTSTHLANSTALLPTPPTSWAGIVKVGRLHTPNQVLGKFNPDIPAQHTRLQQRLLHDAKMVLVKIDAEDLMALQDCSLNGTFDLCKSINMHLAEVNKAMADMSATDSVASPVLSTWIRGILALS